MKVSKEEAIDVFLSTALVVALIVLASSCVTLQPVPNESREGQTWRHK